MPKTPKFKINDLVYLETSARIGQLEAYKIGTIQNKGSDYIYQIFIEQRPPTEAGVSDRNTLKPTSELFFTENELITGCEAMEIVLLALDQQFSKTILHRDSICDISGQAVRLSPRTPDKLIAPIFSIDESVWIKASAKIGFLETHKVTNVYTTPDSKNWKYELDIFGDHRDRDNIGQITLGFNRFVARHQRLVFLENELISECDALNLVIDYLERKIIKIASDFTAVCESI